MLIRRIEKRLKYMDQHLSRNKFLPRKVYSISNIYAVAILRICEHVELKLKMFPSIVRYKNMLEGMNKIGETINKEDRSSLVKTAA